MHSWEDFVFGTKPSDAIARSPEGAVSIAISKTRVTLVHKKSLTRIPIVVVILLYWAARTRSEDVTEASAGTRSLGPLPFQLILPREHLLGDWDGTRTWLEDHGITPTLTFVTDSLGNPTGGREEGFTTANNVGLDLNFDLEKLCGFEG